MGQILLCGVVWVDKVGLHKKLEKRAEIEESMHFYARLLRARFFVYFKFFVGCIFLLHSGKFGTKMGQEWVNNCQK